MNMVTSPVQLVRRWRLKWRTSPLSPVPMMLGVGASSESQYGSCSPTEQDLSWLTASQQQVAFERHPWLLRVPAERRVCRFTAYCL